VLFLPIFFKNDPDPKYDLGKDGAFSEFKVLFFASYMSDMYGAQTLKPALEKKGFQVSWHVEIDSFLKLLELSNGSPEHRFDVIGFTSNLHSSGQDARFTELVIAAHRLGCGLFIFADNQPATYHANLVLPEIAGCIVTGHDYGNQVLVWGADPKEPGRFDKNHLVFAGVNSLYEGITICYPCPVILEGKDKEEEIRLETLATSTFDRPVISKLEANGECGRVIVDTGYTKLDRGSWGGQERYVVNSCVWLTNVERRYGIQEPQPTK